MKQINLFYSEISEQFIINERGEKLANVPSENIKGSLEDALKMIREKYAKRKVYLEVDVPEEKSIDEKGENLLEKYLGATKIDYS